jgi:dTDP-4-dehydrorhamnose 3,5-epimerase
MSDDNNFKVYEGMNGVWSRSCKQHNDERGFFMTFMKADEFSNFKFDFAQGSISSSLPRVFRGFHLQINQWQLITVVKGAVRDIFIDIDSDSTTFGMIGELSLSNESINQLLLAPNIAHGYLVGNETAIISYSHSSPYDPEGEIGVSYRSPEFARINLKLDHRNIVSERDQNLHSFREASEKFKFMSNQISKSPKDEI